MNMFYVYYPVNMLSKLKIDSNILIHFQRANHKSSAELDLHPKSQLKKLLFDG